jgi:hypothetical protein
MRVVMTKMTGPASRKCSTDGKLITLITTVQQFIMGVQSSGMVDDHFTNVMTAISCTLLIARKCGTDLMMCATHFALHC